MKIMLRKIIFTILCVGSLISSVFFSIQTDAALVGIWLTFSLFTFVIGWPEACESISFLGSSIKLREVKNTISELRQLAEVNLGAILYIYQMAGRMGGFSDDEKLANYKSIEKVLHKLEFKEEEIKNIQAPWHQIVEGDYVHAILVGSITHPEVPKEKLEMWQLKWKELMDRRSFVSPDELRELFQEFDAYGDKVRCVIEEFEYYKTHKEHRSYEKWKQRGHWFNNQ